LPQPAISSIDMVRRLVAFDTTSRGSNLALIDFVRYRERTRLRRERKQGQSLRQTGPA
jgi:hypothetical protein